MGNTPSEALDELLTLDPGDVAAAMQRLTLLRGALGPEGATSLRAWAGARRDSAAVMALALAHDLDGGPLKVDGVAEVPLGSWLLGRRLGGGGMGHVYLARHAVHRIEAAIKVLRPDSERQGTAQAALQYELEAVARLRHPGIAALLDVGTVPSSTAVLGQGAFEVGGLYLASERVRGGELSDHCGQLGFVAVKHVLMGILDALAHAHARGILHLDLKPDNVLLAGSGALRPRLVDFGLSFRKGSPRGAWLTSGTPAYMAPERYLGDWRAFGPPTDLYSVGCLAVHLLAGAPPFLGSAEVIRDQVLSRAVQVPDHLDVPWSFLEWLRRCTARAPGDRFPTAAAAATALARVPEGFEQPSGSVGMGLAETTIVFDTVALDLPVVMDLDGGAGEVHELRPLGPEPPRLRGAPPPVSALRFGHADLAVWPQQEALRSLWAVLREAQRGGVAQRVALTGGHRLDRRAVVRWLGERAGERGWRWLAVEAGQSLAEAVSGWLDTEGLDGEALTAHLGRRLGGGGAWLDALALGLQGGHGHAAAMATVAAVAAERPLLLTVGSLEGEGVGPLVEAAAALTLPVAVVVAGDGGVELLHLPERDGAPLLAYHTGIDSSASHEVMRLAGGSMAVAVAMVAEVAVRQGWLPAPHGLTLAPGVVPVVPEGAAVAVSDHERPWLEVVAVLGEDLTEDRFRRASQGLGLDAVALASLRRHLVGGQLGEPALRLRLVEGLGDRREAMHRAVAAALAATGAAPERVAPHWIEAEAWSEAAQPLVDGAWAVYQGGDGGMARALIGEWPRVADGAGLPMAHGLRDRAGLCAMLLAWKDPALCVTRCDERLLGSTDPSVRALAAVYRHGALLRSEEAIDLEVFTRDLAVAEACDDAMVRSEAAWVASVVYDLHRAWPEKADAQRRCAAHGRQSDWIDVRLKASFQDALRLIEATHFEEGCDALLAAIEEAAAAGAVRREEVMRGAASAYLRVVGRLEEAREQAIRASGLHVALDEPTHGVGLALLDFTTGRVEEGLEGLARVRGLASTRPANAEWLARLTLTARVVMESDAHDEATHEALVAELCAQLERGVMRQSQLAWFLEESALTAARGGLLDRARATGAQAKGWYEAFGRVDLAERVRQRLHRAGGAAAVP